MTRPRQRLPLPPCALGSAREGELCVAFSAADFEEEARRGLSWDALIVAADAADELRGLRGRCVAAATVPALAYWPRKSAPALEAARKADRARVRGLGFVDCVADGEELTKALHELLADAPPLFNLDK